MLKVSYNPRVKVSDDFLRLRRYLKPVGVFLCIASAYYLSAYLGLMFATVNASISPLWAPTGIAIATLLLTSYRMWPAVFIGAFLVNALISPFLVAIALAGGNTLEALAAAGLVNAFANGKHFLRKPKDIFLFFAFAGLLSTMISATIGVTTLFLSGSLPQLAIQNAWITWWLGDATGAVIIAPLVVVWIRHLRFALAWKQVAEFCAVLVAVTLIGLLIFTDILIMNFLVPPGTIVIPLFAWAAFRFGVRETATVLFIFSLFAIFGTLSGRGPFVLGNLNSSLLLLQTYTASVTVTALMLTAAIAQRTSAIHELGELNREMRRADAAKDEFLAVLGHELRNPLANVFTQAQLMQLPDLKREESEKAIRGIAHQAERMKRLLDDLLDLSRVARGKIVLQLERFDLRSIVQSAQKSVQPAIDKRSHALDIHVPLEPILIDGDAVRLEQIIFNLLDNAAKYTEKGGKIELFVERKGKIARVRVKDSGYGIRADMLSRIFEPFSQLQDPVHAQGGLGIGLKIVKSLVELHGGTVDVRSAGEGAGSEFIVELPIV